MRHLFCSVFYVSSAGDLQGAIITYITAIVAVVLVTAIPTGIIIIILCRIRYLRMKLANYTMPSLQSSEVTSPKHAKSRTFNLHFKDSANVIESGLPSTSTLKPFLGSSNMSIEAPDIDDHPETIVPKGKPPQFPFPKDSSLAPGSSSLP